MRTLSWEPLVGRRPVTPTSRERQGGIALMVVMVVFIILYLVVYHLHYWTIMEEQVAHIRYTDAHGHDANVSVALKALSLLATDLREDAQLSQGAAGGVTGQLGRGLPVVMENLPGGGDGEGEGDEDDGANFLPQNAPGGGQRVTAIDYKHETMFLPAKESVGEAEVKFRIHDHGGRIDLNKLFDYIRQVLLGSQSGEAGVAGAEGLDGLTEDDLIDAVAGAGSSEAAAAELTSRVLQGRTARNRGLRVGRRGAAEGEDEGGDETLEIIDQAGLQGLSGLGDGRELLRFSEPTPELLLRTEEFLGRVLDALIGMNEDMGFFYEEHYSPREIARDIVDYVLLRRRSPIQNIIFHPSELLNVYSVTPELYYGPQPDLLPGEEMLVGDFVLSRDEFGDLVATYVDEERFELEREDETRRFEELQSALPFLQDFPGLGVGRLQASALTRGMSEPVVLYDEEREIDFVLEPPLPRGLRDIFCTFSAGKININTASVPVVYGLLLSLTEGPDGEANFVVSKLREYLDTFQEYNETEEGVDRVVETPDLNQPRRQLPTDEELEQEDALRMGIPDPEILAGLGSGYSDLETNYFTELRQIELIDGYDGSLEDRLNTEGVDKVTAADDTLLQRLTNDLTNVVSFGSTYFTVELKARTPQSKMVKAGFLVVKRDAASRVMEVILWKELE